MWPFSLMRRRRYERRLDAALIILLATMTFVRLEAAQQARIDAWVDQLITKGLGIPAVFHRWASWSAIATCRALAMFELDIDPCDRTYSWKELFRRFEGDDWIENRHYRVWQNFYPNDQATRDARAALRAHGIDIPEADPWSRGDVDALGPTGRWMKSTGLAEWWRSRP